MRQPPSSSSRLRLSRVAALAALLGAPAVAGEVCSNPPMPGGGINASSWLTPDGSDSDMNAWDSFVLVETQTITEVRWRGGYKYNGTYGKAVDFRISFFDSIAGGSQPLIVALPEHESQEVVIATFHTKNDAAETFADTSAGITMYDYPYALKTPVTLQGGVMYWFRVVAGQPTPYPDWGMTTSNFGSHFVFNQGAAMFQNWPNDLSFSLHSEWVNLGDGLAGIAGVPALSGSTTALKVTSAKASSPAWFVGGLSQVNLPFAGGSLIPTPSVILPVNTDATGTASLPFVKPASLPAGLQISIQAWIFDAAAPQSVSANNGITS